MVTTDNRKLHNFRIAIIYNIIYTVIAITSPKCNFKKIAKLKSLMIFHYTSLSLFSVDAHIAIVTVVIIVIIGSVDRA